MTTFKQKVGCWFHERWRTDLVLLLPIIAQKFGIKWTDLCNRHERLEKGMNGERICLWEDSSFLTVSRLFPQVGGRLLKHCLREWPVQLSKSPQIAKLTNRPKISIVLPVAGRDRIMPFQFVLKAFFEQTFRNVEIIVVEHAPEPVFEKVCPNEVKYIFLQCERNQQFNKSMSMNEGVRNAKAPYVLLHDADIVPPKKYIESIVQRLDLGWDAVRPMRLIFHLNSTDSNVFIAKDGMFLPKEVAMVQQNNPGISTAVFKKVYEEIGGHDEQFWGWGGEDLEFLDRLNTVRLFQGSYTLGIHLWHSDAPKKMSGDRNQKLMTHKREIPPEDRIKLLKRKRSVLVN